MPPALPESDSDSAGGDVKDQRMEDAVEEQGGETNVTEKTGHKTASTNGRPHPGALSSQAISKGDESNDEDEDEEDDEDGDEDEETYVVEKIIEHRSDFEDNVMRYLVKWKGYEKKKDRTWEPEENLEGAQDVLEEYWTAIGGKPVPGEDTQSKPKKRGRQSTSTKAETLEPEPKKSRTSKGGRQSNGVQQDMDVSQEYGYTDVGTDGWKPPPAKPGGWDDLVQSVDTVIREENDELWGFLIWKQESEPGRLYRNKAKLPTIYKACPQRMLAFYEKHLVFTGNEAQAENPPAES